MQKYKIKNNPDYTHHSPFCQKKLLKTLYKNLLWKASFTFDFWTMAIKLTPRAQDFSQRYNDLVKYADLAENSAVRGCMIIKPYGYAIWENMRDILDQMIKKTWHQNAYFPLFIPKSYFSKEASHVAGFAKECAVITHYRLKNSENGEIIVDPEAKLEEELIVRPTSETIIWDSYRNWINSYRDLPLMINQWANVVRWEMRTRIFLRSAEFLRQEGHTAHATPEEADVESRKMLGVYSDFVRNFMGIYHYKGEKPFHERFAGAVATYTFETMMQDGKALQAWTSHNLGQNFAKAFDVKFTNKNNEQEYVYATSRGVTTRLIGGLIMSHSDDQGLVLPPAIAPIHLVVVPIFKSEDELSEIMQALQPQLDQLTEIKINSDILGQVSLPFKIKIDDDTQKSPGRKFNERELKGVPLRIAVGKRDLEQGQVELFRRDTMEKKLVKIENLAEEIQNLIQEIQKNILAKHQLFTLENTFTADTYEELKEKVEKWFVLAHRDGTLETAERIQDELKATIRCLPFDMPEEAWIDPLSWKPSPRRVIYAKSY